MAGRTVAKRFCAVKREAGFEILWGETTDSRRSFSEFVDASGKAVLKGASTDNPFFAARAAGKKGARSIPVAAALEPPEPRVPVK
jgi:hypothetical protein